MRKSATLPGAAVLIPAFAAPATGEIRSAAGETVAGGSSAETSDSRARRLADTAVRAATTTTRSPCRPPSS
ncbi:hypothetical protein [Lentzea sp. NPDC060358]|uniref:hypothetical protein n=1 Tax=Lentzea sp. NPDC060358 TaxID=3347103 RepID=UPI00365CBE90